jgi:ABC-type multidrug transport system ATPase subunit
LHEDFRIVQPGVLHEDMKIAKLYGSGSVSDASALQVRAYVDEVLDLVDLTELMFDLVGLPGQSGLSVEQRKRLTIATEMVANPSVMFMDVSGRI